MHIRKSANTPPAFQPNTASGAVATIHIPRVPYFRDTSTTTANQINGTTACTSKKGIGENSIGHMK